jgi:alpha-tubulin suppressor-like RCC1 family protein
MREREASRIVRPRGAPALAALLVAVAGCSDSLVDHAAGAEVLHPSACPPGQVACGGACLAEDAAHCGPACASCASSAPPDPNAGPVCTEAHACGFACNPGWLRVGETCERAVAVSAGFAHTCAITTGGAVKCWGANDHGQLGDGTTGDSAIPVDVDLPAPATAIAAGYVHTCAIVGGAPWCWGDNSTGALGDGTTAGRSTPALVPGVTGATAISAGGGENAGTVVTWYGHSCALAAGSLSCWGGNESGQLGDGTFVQSASPVRVALGSLDGQATAVANGDRHTCAVVAAGVWCWGAAGSWQLGNGNTSNQSRPVQAQGVQNGASAVAAGAAHTCAVVAAPAAALACWGSNSAGQAAGGDNSALTVQRPTAVALAGVAPADVAAGSAYTCVLDGPSGAPTCFGADDASQLSGPAAPRGSVRVALPQRASALAAGYDHACALLDDGGIACWGANGRGQVGAGGVGAPVAAPTPVSGR